MADLGTVAITEETFSHVKKIKFDWTSDADGKATKTTAESYTGQAVRLVIVPGAAPNAPDNLYDVAINDEDGTDVLMGGGADRSASATEQVGAANLGYVANDTLSLSITNAGAAKKGVAYLYIR
jgi:hypothetical protein